MATDSKNPDAADEALKNIRGRIDALDAHIQALISERAACAKAVAKVKNDAGDNASYYRPEREAVVLRKVMARNNGDLPAEEMARLFREIMSACLALEERLKIAFLGPAGTFTQGAALKHFGHSVSTVPHASIDEVFRDVEAGASHFGVVPVENSTEGVVNHTLDMFLQSPLKICGEVELRIHHHLLGNGDLTRIERVYAHQQAHAQCRRWLEMHLPGVEHVAVSSNAEAARQVAGDVTAAAIAGQMAAEIYQLQMLASNIEDEPNNTTRFLVISRKSPPPSGKDKTSMLLSARNQPGALCRLLSPFAKHGISMTRIESRPSRKEAWDYVFFIDIEGHLQELQVAAALKELADEAAMLKILGSYPDAVL